MSSVTHATVSSSASSSSSSSLSFNPVRLVKAVLESRRLERELTEMPEYLLADIGMKRGDIPTVVRDYRAHLLTG